MTLPAPRLSTLALSLVVLNVAVPGCQGDAADPGTLEQLELQPSARFPLASTYYLPLPEGGTWVLAEAPASNQNAVVAGRDGYARFTPVVAGDYVFELEGSEERRELSVVAEVPYEHYNYYPTGSMALVGDELWAAHVFDPHISRVDPDSGEILATIQTGPWPVAVAAVPDRGLALVAHKAGDTLGIIDVEAGRMIDALWVGDEPAEVVVAPDGSRAYVTLATQGEVAVVDLDALEVIARIPTHLHATTLALSEDGATLYVASYCTGTSNRQEFGTDERSDLYDLAVVDTQSLAVTDYIESVGATIGGLLVSGDRLYVATTRVEVEELSAQEGMTAFRHSLVVYDTGSLTELNAADLGRQDSSAGWAVRPFGLTLADGTLWVASEGSNLALGLDPDSLAELHRVEVEGRPRGITSDGSRVFVHGLQNYSLTFATADGTVTGGATLSGDPRPAGVSAGQLLYTGTGAGAGENHGCADCHVDALSDGNVWSTGGFSTSTSRPMFWMEGTYPIGWEGEAYDLDTYLYGSPRPTIGLNVTTELHRDFSDYLSALVPPPAPNGRGSRDGSLSEEALAGRALFESAGCESCHSGPLATNRARLPGGGTQTEHPLVVPSLIGAYRHNFWLVNGAARTLEEAVEAMLPLSGGSLDEAEIASVARYVDELSAREFFLLTSIPRDGDQGVRFDAPIELILSHPVFDDAQNLGALSLRSADGETVDISVEVDGRHLSVIPAQALAHDSAYTLELPAELEAFNEWTLGETASISFATAKAPSLTLEGEYVITIDHPVLDFEAKEYLDDVTVPVVLSPVATSTAYGATLVSELDADLSNTYAIVIDGDIAHFPPLIFPAGPGFLNRSWPLEVQLVDEDEDGVADSADGTMYFRSPGLEANDVHWTLGRNTGGPSCGESEGAHALELMLDDSGEPTISWSDPVEALGYFVTDLDAVIPMGPGAVTGGTTYWALSAEMFPMGFAAPVIYGELPTGAVDVSEDSGATLGGDALPSSSCVKISVVFTDFSSAQISYTVP